MNFHGHSLNLDSLQQGMIEMRDRLKSFHERDGRPWSADFQFPTERQCRTCGRHLGFILDQDEPMLVSQSPSINEFHHEQRRDELPSDTPCPVSDTTEVRVAFTCRSGRVAVGNDFRNLFHQPEFDKDFDINNLAGKQAWINHLATFGYLTGFVGNTSIHFVPRDTGFDVVTLSEPDGGVRQSRSKLTQQVRADLKASVHHFYTELWWFAVVDAADLPEGAMDSYNRKVGYLSLEPGEYEMVYHSALLRQKQDPHREVWAEIRKVPT